MVSEHKLTDAFFKNLTWRALRLVGPLMLLAIFGGWYAAGGDTDLSAVLPFAIIVGIALPIGVGSGMRRQRKSYRSFRIELHEDRIVREQDGLPRLEIPFAEITGLQEVTSTGALTVRRAGPQQMLFLPPTLEGFAEVRARLARIRPIEPLKPRSSVPRMYVTSAVGITCLIVVFRSESVVPVLLCGTILTAALIGGWIQIRRSPHIDKRIKRGMWLLVFVLFSVVMKMWFVATKR